MKKGIIMEIEDGFLMLLTPEGEFLRARKQSQPYSIGEEIYFFPMESVNGSMSKRSIRNIFRLKTVWIVMAAIMIFIGIFIPMYQDDKAYAYMSIDANPSVEMGVNKKMQVVKLTGFNKEGKVIISHLKNWKKQDVSELTKVILAEMKKGGYLKDNHQVLISTVSIEQPEQKVEDELQRKLDKIEASVNDDNDKEKEKIELVVLAATEKEYKKAHSLGITPGKYKYQSSQEKSKQKNVESKQKNKEDTVPAQSQSTNTMPPGQSNKQPENNGVKPGWENGGEKNNWDKNSNSPGYLKKLEEENSKQNQGQYRKHNDSQWKRNEHRDSNQSNNYKQNNNNSHNNNNNRNDERKNDRNESYSEHNGNNNRKNN